MSRRPNLIAAAPGIAALLLFLTIALGRAVLGDLAAPLAAILAALLAAAVIVQPGARRRLAAALRHPLRLHYAAIAAVVVLAAALRLPGIRFGLPYLEHPDEWAVADEALRMLRSGSYSPFSYTYPTLYIYMQVAVAAVHYLWGVSAGLYRALGDIQPALFYPWARALTAILGTASVGLTYILGRALYRRRTGLLAAAMLAVLPAVAGDAHYVTTDTPAMFFALAALLAIVWAGGVGRSDAQPTERSEPPDRLLRFLLAGVVVGLACAVKYNVAVLLLPLLLASIWRRRGGASAVAALPIAAIAGVAIGFTIGVPLWLAELQRLLSDLASIVIHYRFTGHPGAESKRPALFYWWALSQEGLPFALMGLGGTALAFVRRSRADLLLLAFLVPSVLQLTGVTVVFFRNTMPLLPVICILAGEMIVVASAALSRLPLPPGRAPRPWMAAALILVICMAQPLLRAAHDEALRASPTTRNLADAWVKANAPEGSKIWLEDNTLTLPSRLLVRGGRPVSSNPPAWYAQQGFSYLVVHTETGEDLSAFGAPLVSFARDDARHGPNLAIFSVGAADDSGESRTASGATLGTGALLLEGYRYPAEVRAGATLPLALYWRAARPLSQNYTVYIHLVDAAGAKLAQRDMPPRDGSLPTTNWRVGELIRDDQDLPVAAGVAPGRYRLLVGMYDPQTLAPINDAGPIDLGEVTVLAGD